MRSIFKYIISRISYLLLLIIMASALTPSSAQFKSDDKYGLRLGIDLSRIPVHYFNLYRTDFEIQADARVDSDLYIAADAGWNKTHLDNKPVFEYNSNGVYLKAGVDYNLIKLQFPQEANMVYAGFRYGIARMTRSIPQYQINDPYWGNVNGSFSSKALMPQWGELILGMKAEVLNNFFMGWALHLRILTTQNIGNPVRPYIIPGFGNATKNSVFDVSYTISYRIPMWKPKLKPPREKHKAEKKTEEGKVSNDKKP
ncbi:MAG: hypothetical protein EPN39_03100 [Chitinophagaceae bacterium]|nr:MAG: hypothetical protein EPN39_03100 [Chitinophagaceae bacterium]